MYTDYCVSEAYIVTAWSLTETPDWEQIDVLLPPELCPSSTQQT